MRPLEQETGYDYIYMNYDRRLNATVGKDLRVTLIRMRFGFGFIIFWAVAITMIFRSLPSLFSSLPATTVLPLDAMLYVLIIILPWVVYAGKSALRVIAAITQATWGKEV